MRDDKLGNKYRKEIRLLVLRKDPPQLVQTYVRLASSVLFACECGQQCINKSPLVRNAYLTFLKVTFFVILTTVFFATCRVANCLSAFGPGFNRLEAS